MPDLKFFTAPQTAPKFGSRELGFMERLFWASFAFIFYVYFGYPAWLALRQRVSARPVRKEYREAAVSIVIAAHNERQRLEKKLENCLALDYPKQKLQIVVSLDGPSDGSECLVSRYGGRGVKTVHSRVHRGKAAALNSALRRATGEIVVFADVRQTFDRRAVRELVANFSDRDVGAVSGELLLMDKSENEATTDVGLYWRYEKALRVMESRIHSVAGATGAIYAIRRELWEELPEDTLLDDVLTPLRIVLKGKRAVFDSSAKAYDSVACCPLGEYGRKVRTLAGNFQLLSESPQLLAPWRNPIFFNFISHKIARLFVPYALVALFVSNLFILRGFYLIPFALQTAWYLCAAAGYFASRCEAREVMPEPGRRAA